MFSCYDIKRIRMKLVSEVLIYFLHDFDITKHVALSFSFSYNLTRVNNSDPINVAMHYRSVKSFRGLNQSKVFVST